MREDGILYINVDNVSIVFNKDDKQKVMKHFPELNQSDLKRGWISDKNPTNTLFGFYICRYLSKEKIAENKKFFKDYKQENLYNNNQGNYSDDERFSPDFSNLPYFYYQYTKSFPDYNKLLIEYISKNELFTDWEGGCSRLPWEHLRSFVKCLSDVPIKNLKNMYL